MTTKKTLILSLSAGFLAVLLSALYLNIKEREVAGGGELKRVLVAAVDIKPQTLLEPGIVRFKKVPKIYIQPGALASYREIEGNVSIVGLKAGEQITGSRIIAGGSKSGLSFKLPHGQRAVSILLKDSEASGGLIQPDDHVDIFVTFDYGDSERSSRYTYALFQNVQVLAVGPKMHSPRNPERIAVVEKESGGLLGSAPAMVEARSRGSVYTFGFSAGEAEKFVFAASAGKVSLALRSPADHSIVTDTIPVKLETLTGRAGFLRRDFREYKGR